MSVRKEISEYSGIYFITVTCSKWLHLFEIANAYDEVYKCPSDRVIRAEFDI